MTVLVAALAVASAPPPPSTALVPWPASIEFLSGSLTIGKGVALTFDNASDATGSTAAYLNGCLAKDAKVVLPARPAADWNGPAIRFTTSGADPALGDEGYSLVVSKAGIIVRAPKPAGLFYGAQTVRQLIGRQYPAKVPHLRIIDKPRFGWRGLLLDVSRHFRDIEFVKRQIDLLAFHKMNVFHWHLVDDQGWRLEIKRYPKLTEVGAWRQEASGRYGGFYTQAQVREIVDYAAKRFITVVPEIEMPGHCNAALAAYPEYSCTGGPFTTPTLWGVFSDVYCAGNEGTYAFNEGILEETLALFPSKFIHIGGDEVPKTRWQACAKCQAKIKAEGLKDEHELQSYFVRRIDKWLTARGRRLVGWDEILEGGLAPGATVQSWRGMEGAIDAAKMGHDVIVSPTSHCYLDYPYTTTSVEKSYSFEPVPAELTAEQAKHVLGGEGNMWAERTPLPDDTDRMVFPRLSALAEVYWSPKVARSWAAFKPRLDRHLDTLAAMGVKFFVPPPSFLDDESVFLDKVTVRLNPGPGAIVYTLDGSDPGPRSPRYTKPLVLTNTTTVKAATMRGNAVGTPVSRTFRKVTLREPIVFVRAPDPGLRWHKYEGRWSTLPDFGKLTATSSGTTETPGTGVAEREDDFALVFEGVFMAPKDGIYTFFTSSDDGSALWVGEEKIVDNDGLHAVEERAGQVALKAGWHPIRIAMFEAGGSQALSVSVRPPGGQKRPVALADFGR